MEPDDKLFKEASDALFEGDGEKAARLFDEGTRAIVAARQPAVDVAALADSIATKISRVRQAEQDAPAIKRLREEFPEIVTDPDYALITDRKIADLQTTGISRTEAILRAGQEIGEKFGLGKQKQQTPPRAAKAAEPDETAGNAQIIEAMRREREAPFASATEEGSGRHERSNDEMQRFLAFRKYKATSQA